MCGIAGYFGSKKIGDLDIYKCRQLMSSRGPDGSGLFSRQINTNLNVQILHSRLRVLDLDPRSDQPFHTSHGCLSFNGEIYNYIEIRNKLKKEGNQFISEGDTEVLAKVLDTKGILGLDLCEGMWSFAWLNKSVLTLARDRFGEKPFYIYEDETGFYFGSEPKYIFALLGRKLEINKKQILRYLVNGYKSLYKTKETFFNGLYEVPPGHFVEIDDKLNKFVKKYWSPNLEERDQAMEFDEAVKDVRAALISSVGMRLRSDVPIGFCLSGGVDSNAIVGIAKNCYNYDVHGFTIMNDDSRYEEKALIETVVKKLKIQHTPITAEKRSFLDNLRSIINYHDSPISTITYYAHWQLMSFIADSGYKVSISGTGADELFSGYYDHHNFFIAQLSGDHIAQNIARKKWFSNYGQIVRNPYLKDPDCFIKDPKLRDHIYLDAQIFSEYLIAPWFEGFKEEIYCSDILRNRMINELFHESVPVILHEDDLNSMYFSVENRSPFLDRALFDVCQRIPTNHLIRDGKAKAVLRESVRGLVINEILDNPRKVGFNVPILDYLDITDVNVINELLRDSPIFELVNRYKIEMLLSNPYLKNSESKFLFNFINAKIFLEEYER